MSAQLNLTTVKLGNNADTSKNFLISVPSVADGTLTITRESDSRQSLAIDINGRITFPSGSPSEAYVLVREEQASGTAGGGSTAATWQTRVLNTEVSDASNIATLASNQVTLPAGTYRFSASAPAFAANSHKVRLQNITDSTTVVVGGNAASATGVQTSGTVVGRFTIATSKAFSLQHWCVTAQGVNGLGLATSIASVVEVYSQLEFWKEM